jgi:probable phosphoglycerate mutase
MNNPLLPLIPFYFIRHGQTGWNREQKVMGHIDIPLDSIGIEQAHHACSSLKNLGIERIVTSPLQRASTTAAIIGTYLRINPEPIEGLSEICWGAWQGKTVADGYNFEKWVAGYTPQGAESCEDFQKRVTDTICAILRTLKKTLVVSHNGIYRALLKTIGYTVCEARNCIPYLFQPQDDSIYPWIVLSLKDPGDSKKEHVISGQKWFQVKL